MFYTISDFCTAITTNLQHLHFHYGGHAAHGRQSYFRKSSEVSKDVLTFCHHKLSQDIRKVNVFNWL